MSKSLRVAAVDLNGQLRGKRVPKGMSGKQMRMPLSVLNIDVFGADIQESPLVFETGDQDGIMEPVVNEISARSVAKRKNYRHGRFKYGHLKSLYLRYSLELVHGGDCERGEYSRCCFLELVMCMLIGTYKAA